MKITNDLHAILSTTDMSDTVIDMLEPATEQEVFTVILQYSIDNLERVLPSFSADFIPSTESIEALFFRNQLDVVKKLNIPREELTKVDFVSLFSSLAAEADFVQMSEVMCMSHHHEALLLHQLYLDSSPEDASRERAAQSFHEQYSGEEMRQVLEDAYIASKTHEYADELQLPLSGFQYLFYLGVSSKEFLADFLEVLIENFGMIDNEIAFDDLQNILSKGHQLSEEQRCQIFKNLPFEYLETLIDNKYIDVSGANDSLLHAAFKNSSCSYFNDDAKRLFRRCINDSTDKVNVCDMSLIADESMLTQEILPEVTKVFGFTPNDFLQLLQRKSVFGSETCQVLLQIEDEYELDKETSKLLYQSAVQNADQHLLERLYMHSSTALNFLDQTSVRFPIHSDTPVDCAKLWKILKAADLTSVEDIKRFTSNDSFMRAFEHGIITENSRETLLTMIQQPSSKTATTRI